MAKDKTHILKLDPVSISEGKCSEKLHVVLLSVCFLFHGRNIYILVSNPVPVNPDIIFHIINNPNHFFFDSRKHSPVYR